MKQVFEDKKSGIFYYFDADLLTLTATDCIWEWSLSILETDILKNSLTIQEALLKLKASLSQANQDSNSQTFIEFTKEFKDLSVTSGYFQTFAGKQIKMKLLTKSAVYTGPVNINLWMSDLVSQNHSQKNQLNDISNELNSMKIAFDSFVKTTNENWDLKVKEMTSFSNRVGELFNKERGITKPTISISNTTSTNPSPSRPLKRMTNSSSADESKTDSNNEMASETDDNVSQDDDVEMNVAIN